MPPLNSCAVYNKDFATAVIKANVICKSSFRFMGKTYKTADHVAGVARDINDGYYKVKIQLS